MAAEHDESTRANDAPDTRGVDFIRQRVIEDNRTGKYGGRVHTRFPPEPNGYLHIGHAKSICLNFGVAREFAGKANLRYDDTNPLAEDVEYVDAIEKDVRWLGFDWEGRKFYASDYFEQLYGFAVQLIQKGKAFVCHLSAEEMSEQRGAPTAPGKESPYRNRTIEENLDLFERMRKGEFKDGECTLRAKIDMASSNLNLRDPALYRIRHAAHHRTGTQWCIYPMYDFAHGFSDSLEGITHSICTLEFENHRPLYDWLLIETGAYRPQQIEFARLNLTYTIMSKRKLLRLVNGGHVSGWDDPRMPTLHGMRRRGYTPEAIRALCETVGVTRINSTIDFQVLEGAVRDDLNRRSLRKLAVLRPLELVIENYPAGQTEEMDVVNHPEDEARGTRKVPFGARLFIERDDFMVDPPKNYFRLGVGREVRLRAAYFVKCTGFDVDPATGAVARVRCTYDPATRGGNAPDGRKVKGTIHWVTAEHAIDAEARLYDQLFTAPFPEDVPEGQDFTVNLNPNSLEVLKGCKLEPSLASAKHGDSFQFERLGYFCIDSEDSKSGALVFNRTATLRDSWAKQKNA